ncbi:MAG: SET domain-containing protein [Gammaproteobacteria bacterium]|nr:SET domain-containing protein [Gammaproteobacteria bacterium]
MDQAISAHYVNPKLEARPARHKGGYALFAVEPVARGELLVVWGGVVITGEQLTLLPSRRRAHSIQVEENLYQLSPEERHPADFINHSCSPNAGLSGQISLVALFPITPGEEICYDYAMSDGTTYDEFDCACGAVHCRGRVTGSDWKLPELQRRYNGYFSPYLQHRIERLRREQQRLVHSDEPVSLRGAARTGS